MNGNKVSFDFDGTLDKIVVQEFAIELLSKGYDVFITTQRLEPSKSPSLSWNDDLFEIADYIGIKRKNIIFCNLEHKYKIINDIDFLFHIDDDFTELKLLRDNTKIKPVSVFGNKYWKMDCLEILNNRI